MDKTEIFYLVQETIRLILITIISMRRYVDQPVFRFYCFNYRCSGLELRVCLSNLWLDSLQWWKSNVFQSINIHWNLLKYFSSQSSASMDSLNYSTTRSFHQLFRFISCSNRRKFIKNYPDRVRFRQKLDFQFSSWSASLLADWFHRCVFVISNISELVSQHNSHCSRLVWTIVRWWKQLRGIFIKVFSIKYRPMKIFGFSVFNHFSISVWHRSCFHSVNISWSSRLVIKQILSLNGLYPMSSFITICWIQSINIFPLEISTLWYKQFFLFLIKWTFEIQNQVIDRFWNSTFFPWLKMEFFLRWFSSHLCKFSQMDSTRRAMYTTIHRGMH